MSRLTRPKTTWINGDTLHVEAPGCIVNIHVGLATSEGSDVTAISIQCDQYAGEAKWTLPDYGDAKHLNVRAVKGDHSR